MSVSSDIWVTHMWVFCRTQQSRQHVGVLSNTFLVLFCFFGRDDRNCSRVLAFASEGRVSQHLQQVCDKKIVL